MISNKQCGEDNNIFQHQISFNHLFIVDYTNEIMIIY
jgi:hypothetical protein